MRHGLVAQTLGGIVLEAGAEAVRKWAHQTNCRELLHSSCCAGIHSTWRGLELLSSYGGVKPLETAVAFGAFLGVCEAGR